MLVTGAGAPGVKGTIYSLKNNNDNREVFIVGTDMKEDVVGSHICDAFRVIPSSKSANEYLEAILAVCKNDKIDVLLLNANYCANGINLENSSDIVLYHSMNKDRTTQIIGRGQRPGRNDALNVWNLCYENEL